MSRLNLKPEFVINRAYPSRMRAELAAIFIGVVIFSTIFAAGYLTACVVHGL